MNGHKYTRFTLPAVSLCVLVPTCSCTLAPSQAAKVKDEPAVLRLTIQTEKKSYVRGDTIPIDVQLTNVSTRDIFIGRDIWTNASPSRVRLAVTARDGHMFGGIEGAVDGLAPDAFRDLPKAVLAWCISLPPGYSYGSRTRLQNFVEEASLTPGVYVVRASFESRGIDADSYFNPLLDNPTELGALRAQDWKGVIGSNQLTVRIVADQAR
jgi:hypothetical protein